MARYPFQIQRQHRVHGNWEDRRPMAATVQQICEVFDTVSEYLDNGVMNTSK